MRNGDPRSRSVPVEASGVIAVPLGPKIDTNMNFFASVVTIISVAVFFTNIPNYTYGQHGLMVPYLWVSMFAVISLPLLIRVVSKSNVLGSTVISWCFLYILLTILWFIPSSQNDVAWQEVRSRALTVIELMMFLMVFASEGMNWLARQVLVVGVLVGVGLNIYELFVPLSFSPIIGRSAGMYVNPTTSSFALVGGMIFAVTVLPRWARGVFILIVGIGVVSTFSRGGIIGWCVASASFVLTKQITSKDVVHAALTGILIIGMLVMTRGEEFLDTLNRTGVINANVEERLSWLTDPSGVQDQSSWARAYVAKRLWDKWAEQPFFGSGTGAAYAAFEIPPHNQYLVFMVDHGLIGIMVFPLLILSVIYEARGEFRLLVMLFGGIQAVNGFMSHTLLTEPQTLLLFALAATLPARKTTNVWSHSQRIEQDALSPQLA